MVRKRIKKLKKILGRTLLVPLALTATAKGVLATEVVENRPKSKVSRTKSENVTDEDKDSANSAYIIATEQDGHVEAETRLDILKEALKANPGMNIKTKISADILWNLYEIDKNFIEKSVSDRSNKDAILKSMNHIHDVVVKAGWNKEMSFSDLNWIGRIWAYLLSSAPESQQYAVTDKYGKMMMRADAQELTAYLESSNIDISFNKHEEGGYSESWNRYKGFAMPVISPTGGFPLSAMRNAWAFFPKEGDEEATYLDFLAVPTDKLADFDYTRGHPPCDGWEHDRIHIGKYRGEAAALPSAKLSARMLQKLYEAKLTEAELNKFDIALFHVFHEEQQPLEKDSFSYRIGVVKNQAINKLNAKEIIPVENTFNSIEQYEGLVEGAESVGLKLEGKDTIEKYRSYLKILLEGIAVMETYAQGIYDGPDA